MSTEMTSEQKLSKAKLHLKGWQNAIAHKKRLAEKAAIEKYGRIIFEKIDKEERVKMGAVQEAKRKLCLLELEEGSTESMNYILFVNDFSL
jgi:hypothetical protein